MTVYVKSVTNPELPAFPMPDRFRHDVTYFATPAGSGDAPAKLGEGEFWIPLAESRTTLDDGVIRLVSPLDSEHTTEIEITEEQERWLEWMIKHQIQHVLLSARADR
ncbi:MAG: hypothetical protein WEB58_11265 [Planctomycetaceae bacterium]